MNDEPQEFDELVGGMIDDRVEPLNAMSVMVDFNDLYVRYGEVAFDIVGRLKDTLE